MLNLIFPSICPICESVTNDKLVCDDCLDGVRFIKDRALCSKCGLPFGYTKYDNDNIDSEYLCGKCLRGEYYFERARSIAFYDGLLREILHKFKYQGKLHLGRVLSGILIQNYPYELGPIDIVVPVPLYIGKLRTREYNQTIILARELANYIKVPFEPLILKKVKETRPQFEITNEKDRKKNVRGAFILENIRRVREKSVLLFDDVFTTGSTINECTRILGRAGASNVHVLTLMRAA
ncbi:ComF family protein [Desulfobacterota bacterium AH_259_B03_O07]|nr:ComF family protein [Desulfobacterota bacterium AH_259_B03_O07]